HRSAAGCIAENNQERNDHDEPQNHLFASARTSAPGSSLAKQACTPKLLFEFVRLRRCVLRLHIHFAMEMSRGEVNLRLLRNNFGVALVFVVAQPHMSFHSQAGSFRPAPPYTVGACRKLLGLHDHLLACTLILTGFPAPILNVSPSQLACMPSSVWICNCGLHLAFWPAARKVQDTG